MATKYKLTGEIYPANVLPLHLVFIIIFYYALFFMQYNDDK